MGTVAEDVAEAVTAPASTRNVMNVLVAVALALIVYFTKGTLDEIGKLRGDMTTVQVNQAQLTVQVTTLTAALDNLSRATASRGRGQ